MGIFSHEDNSWTILLGLMMANLLEKDTFNVQKNMGSLLKKKRSCLLNDATTLYIGENESYVHALFLSCLHFFFPVEEIEKIEVAFSSF